MSEQLTREQVREALAGFEWGRDGNDERRFEVIGRAARLWALWVPVTVAETPDPTPTTTELMMPVQYESMSNLDRYQAETPDPLIAHSQAEAIMKMGAYGTVVIPVGETPDPTPALVVRQGCVEMLREHGWVVESRERIEALRKRWYPSVRAALDALLEGSE